MTKTIGAGRQNRLEKRINRRQDVPGMTKRGENGSIAVLKKRRGDVVPQVPPLDNAPKQRTLNHCQCVGIGKGDRFTQLRRLRNAEPALGLGHNGEKVVWRRLGALQVLQHAFELLLAHHHVAPRRLLARHGQPVPQLHHAKVGKRLAPFAVVVAAAVHVVVAVVALFRFLFRKRRRSTDTTTHSLRDSVLSLSCMMKQISSL
jgi:hypothetical protein